jgi:hypothetical protein
MFYLVLVVRRYLQHKLLSYNPGGAMASWL